MKTIRIITKTKDCIKCDDTCCEFRKIDTHFAPIFTKSEIKKIKKHFKIRQGLYFKKYKRSKDIFQVKLRKHKDSKFYYCPFFNKKTRLCKIYKSCPLDCKMWPFLIAKSKDGKKVNIVCFNRDYCLSLMKIKKKEFDNYVKYLIKFITSKGFIDFLKSNPEYIWNYEKDTFVIKDITNLLKK